MLHILQLLYHDGMSLGLTYQAQHLGMSLLAEDDDLRLGIVNILLFDAALKLEHHRTGGIDNLDVVAFGKGIGLRWLSVGTKQNLHTVEFLHLIMVDGGQTSLMQALHLHTVMYDVTQTVKLTALLQLFLSFLDGSGHAKAETTAVIYFYLHVF